jgi:tRNA A-37 threonylcarbamoyl transferase component Bud32
MAEVFLGTVIGAEGFTREVAIKRVRAGHSDEPAFAEMFVGEARIAAQISHPNVVSVLDFDRDAEGRLFLVMELVDGKDLAVLSAAGRLPPAIAVFVVSEVLRGLGHAHELPNLRGGRGYVHRDVSPHNVLVSWQGAVKVTDFGIAKALEASGRARSAIVKGKPGYMSPEQVDGDGLDGRSDLFAVGIVLWELLAGRKLFTGGTREMFAKILFHDVPRPSEFAAGVPADLEAVTMKLLARDREDRYETAEAAIEALARCADNPRNGRSELARWMAGRFPDEVRARGRPPPEEREVRRRDDGRWGARRWGERQWGDGERQWGGGEQQWGGDERGDGEWVDGEWAERRWSDGERDGGEWADGEARWWGEAPGEREAGLGDREAEPGELEAEPVTALRLPKLEEVASRPPIWPKSRRHVRRVAIMIACAVVAALFAGVAAHLAG